MEPLEKFSISLIKTHYYFLTIQMVMTLNVDERNVLLGVETISVIWKVDRCDCWTASLCPSRFRLYAFPPCSVPCKADFNRVTHWGSCASGFQSTTANGRHRQISGQGLCFSLKDHSYEWAALSNSYTSCWFSFWTTSPSLNGFPYLGYIL